MLEIMNYDGVEAVIADIDRVRSCATRDGAAVIRGVLSGERIKKAVAIMQAQFDAAKDLRSVPPFAPKTGDYHRLDIGAYGSNQQLFRFARIFYFFPWNENDLGLGEELTAMSRVRNLLSGMDQNHGLNVDLQPEGDAFCYTLAVNHYPRGGGFMAGHVDSPNFTQSEFSNNFVVAMPMSKIGEDFNTGGSWAVLDNEKISWEGLVDVGDLLIYDQKILHGVDAVDQRETLDMANLTGRLFAFASPTLCSA